MSHFITDHATMTPEEINRAMFSFLSGLHTFDDEMPATSENLNWMVSVYAIDHGAVGSEADLQNLLAAMNKHYAGPISIHEGWGGCEADSNQELITEKLRFDLGENFGSHNVQATIAAINLGWLSADDYEERLDDCVSSLNLAPATFEEGEFESDWLDLTHRNWADRPPVLSVYAYGKTEADRWRYREQAELPCTEAEYHRLLLRLGQFSSNDDKCAYVRFWLARKGAPMQEIPL